MRIASLALVSAVVLAILGTALPLSAGVINDSWQFEGGMPTPTVAGPDWGSSAWTLVGNAFYADDGGEYITHRLRITDNNLNRSGSAWLNSTQILPRADWSASMRCQLTYPGGIAPADGMGMVFQTQGPTATATGYYTSFTAPSLVVDICTYDADLGGAHENAMRVIENGALLQEWPLGTNVENTVYYNLFASYVAATKTLTVRYQGDGLDTTETVNTDLLALFGNNTTATFGYTASTGDGTDNHDVLDGTLSGSVPEPSSLSLLALGALALLRRRRA